jgi:hypothetical protein
MTRKHRTLNVVANGTAKATKVPSGAHSRPHENPTNAVDPKNPVNHENPVNALEPRVPVDSPDEDRLRCLAIQEVWSSAFDGEDVEDALAALSRIVNSTTVQTPGDDTTVGWKSLSLENVENHMLRCPRCAAVLQSTSRFKRLRVHSADSTFSDLRPAIRAAIIKDSPNTAAKKGSSASIVHNLGRRQAMVPSLSIALAITGAAQALGALPDLFGSINAGMWPGSPGGIEHLTREAAASEIALAAGFLYVALKPFAVAAVRTMASILTTLVIFSTLSSLSSGNAALPVEAHHLIALFGTALLWLLPTTSPSARGSRSSSTRNFNGRLSL